MEIIDAIETAAGTAIAAIEQPFLTVAARLKTAGEHLSIAFMHPYCPPALQGALTDLHSVVSDLAQEVAELRVPCPCKAAPTSATNAPAPAIAEVATVIDGLAASPADLAEFAEWKRAKAAAELTNQSGA